MEQHTEPARAWPGSRAHRGRPLAPVCRITRTVECDGGSLFVQETLPEGEAAKDYVLFVHGNEVPSAAEFDLPVPGYSLVEHLAGHGMSCCMFDHRGYGRSFRPRPSEPVGIEARARDLERVHQFLLQERGATSVALVGLGAGCNTIAAMQARARLDVRALVFMRPCYLFDEYQQRAAVKSRLLRTLRALAGLPESHYAGLNPGMIRKALCVGGERLIDGHVVDEFVRQATTATSPRARRLVAPLLAFPAPYDRYEPWQPMFDVEPLARLPLLLLRGCDDELCCERSARSFVDACRAAGMNVIEVSFPGRKRDLHLYAEHDDFFEAIGRFLRC